MASSSSLTPSPFLPSSPPPSGCVGWSLGHNKAPSVPARSTSLFCPSSLLPPATAPSFPFHYFCPDFLVFFFASLRSFTVLFVHCMLVFAKFSQSSIATYRAGYSNRSRHGRLGSAPRGDPRPLLSLALEYRIPDYRCLSGRWWSRHDDYRIPLGLAQLLTGIDRVLPKFYQSSMAVYRNHFRCRTTLRSSY